MKRSRKTASLPKAACGFAAGFLQAAGEIGGVFDHAHAAAAAAEGGFDDEGEADVTRRSFRRGLGIVDGLLGAGDDGDAGFLGEAAGGGLVAEEFEQVGAGADEGDAGLGAGAREGGIFGQEAVAGMDGIDALFLGQGDDALDIEVGFDRAFAFADEVGFVGLEAVEGEAVFLGIDGDGAQAEFVGGAQNADGDFAAVQREKLLHDCKQVNFVGWLSDYQRGMGGTARQREVVGRFRMCRFYCAILYENAAPGRSPFFLRRVANGSGVELLAGKRASGAWAGREAYPTRVVLCWIDSGECVADNTTAYQYV